MIPILSILVHFCCIYHVRRVVVASYSIAAQTKSCVSTHKNNIFLVCQPVGAISTQAALPGGIIHVAGSSKFTNNTASDDGGEKYYRGCGGSNYGSPGLRTLDNFSFPDVV